jgi:hypothetical protein
MSEPLKDSVGTFWEVMENIANDVIGLGKFQPGYRKIMYSATYFSLGVDSFRVATGHLTAVNLYWWFS